MPHGTDTKDRNAKLGNERVALPLKHAHGRKEPKRDGTDSHMCAREREDVPEAIIIHELLFPMTMHVAAAVSRGMRAGLSLPLPWMVALHFSLLQLIIDEDKP